MDIFTVGIITLLISALVFYVVLFSFIYYWHLKKISFIVIPAIFTFEFFLKGVVIISITTIILKYVPEIIRIFGI